MRISNIIYQNDTVYKHIYSVAAHMSEEAAGHHGGLSLAGLQLGQEVVAVEVVEFLQVAEDDTSLAPEVLGDVWSVQQGEVVGQDVAQRADVLPLCEHQLLQDTLQPPGDTNRTNTTHWCSLIGIRPIYL